MTLREQYPDMPTLLAAIRAHPGMFLGKPTISGLHWFLLGLRFAEEYHAVSTVAPIAGFDSSGFEQWVDSKYNSSRGSHNSFSLAAQVAGTEDAGFQLWFKWYDEYVVCNRTE